VALRALRDPRAVARIAREAALSAVRIEALARVEDPRLVATLAKVAEDPVVRMEALARVAEPALLLDVALRAQHKAVAVAAVERLGDDESLRAVAAGAAHKAAARHAEARLSTAAPAAEDPARMASEASDEVRLLPSPSDATVEPSADAPPPPETAEVVEASPAEEAPSGESDGNADADRADTAALFTRDDAPQPEAIEGAPAHADPEPPRKDRIARVESLCDRIERLTSSENLVLREADTALREARSLHEHPHERPQEHAHALPGRLEHRLKVARAALYARVQEVREAKEWTGWANVAIQEELCARLESLSEEADLDRVARELRESDIRWAQARYAPKEQAQALRDRYQAARGKVRTRLQEFFKKKADERAASLAAKVELCERAEALRGSTDWIKTSEEIKGLQARWKEVGRAAPREERQAWKRFHAACDGFFKRRQEDLRHRREEWSANLAQKVALCERAEALVDSTEWEKTAAEVRRLQSEWKSVGSVKRSQSEAVWFRFRRACDAYFDRYKHRDEVESAQRRAEREALCEEMEALVTEGQAPPDGLAERVLSVMARARKAPTLAVADEEALTRRLVTARNGLIERYPASFKGTELDPEENRLRREKLCHRVEALAVAEEEEGPLTGETLARRLKEALAANTMGARRDGGGRADADRAVVESARAAWKRLGPVPGEA
ncbi:MAG TPA: DUF349 domain-containing protein, partial [Vicinamibacteria bacterium]